MGENGGLGGNLARKSLEVDCYVLYFVRLTELQCLSSIDYGISLHSSLLSVCLFGLWDGVERERNCTSYDFSELSELCASSFALVVDSHFGMKSKSLLSFVLFGRTSRSVALLGLQVYNPGWSDDS